MAEDLQIENEWLVKVYRAHGARTKTQIGYIGLLGVDFLTERSAPRNITFTELLQQFFKA